MTDEKKVILKPIGQNKPQKQGLVAGMREGLTSLVGCDKVPDFGTKTRAKIEAHKEKVRQEQLAMATQKKISLNQEKKLPTQARLEAIRAAYRRVWSAHFVKAPVLPTSYKIQEPFVITPIMRRKRQDMQHVN